MKKLFSNGFKVLLMILTLNNHAIAQHTSNEITQISVDLSKTIAPMKPIWAWFGYDEPNYTYMKDGEKLLSELAALSPGPVHVRTHSLLVSGDGVAAPAWTDGLTSAGMGGGLVAALADATMRD